MVVMVEMVATFVMVVMVVYMKLVMSCPVLSCLVWGGGGGGHVNLVPKSTPQLGLVGVWLSNHQKEIKCLPKYFLAKYFVPRNPIPKFQQFVTPWLRLFAKDL